MEHTLTELSELPENTRPFLGSTSSAKTQLLCPSQVSTHSSVLTSHTRTVASLEPEYNRSLDSFKAKTSSECFLADLTHFNCAMSHTCTAPLPHPLNNLSSCMTNSRTSLSLFNVWRQIKLSRSQI